MLDFVYSIFKLFTISLQNFMDRENIFPAIRETNNSVKYTHTGMNNSTSLIDHFLVSDNMCLLIRKYYRMDSVDNLSDHIPLFTCISLDCVVNTVPVEAVKVNNRSPVWRLASSCIIEQYQLELDSILQSSYPKAEMFLDNSGNNLCLKMEYVSNFHDMIMQAANNAMDKHIPHTGDRKPNVIPGWDVEMDCARQSSLFWHDTWRTVVVKSQE